MQSHRLGANKLHSNMSQLFHHQLKMRACSYMYSTLPNVCMQQCCQSVDCTKIF